MLGALNYKSYTVNGYLSGWSAHTFKGTNAVSVGLSSLARSGSAFDMATGRTLAGATLVHKGLPVIGFSVRTLNNGLLDCTTFGGSAGTCVGSYGLLTDHRYDVSTSPTP